MSRVVALAGLGDGAAPAPSATPRTLLLWGVVAGVTVGIFVGTLMLNPSKRSR